MVPLSRHLEVVRLAQWVVVAPGKSRGSPPRRMWKWFTSDLVARMEATIQVYVTLRPLGMADFSTNKTVLVPVGMRVPTPWARYPK